MYLIHFPGPPNSDTRSTKNEALRAETWMAISKLYDESKVHAVGVSNFTLRHLMQLTEVMAIGPMVNQVGSGLFVKYEYVLVYTRPN